MTKIIDTFKQVMGGKPEEVEAPKTNYITTCGFPFAVLEFGPSSKSGEVVVFGTLEGYEKTIVLHWDTHFKRQAFNMFSKVYAADDDNAYADFQHISKAYKESANRGMSVEINNAKEKN